MPMPEVLNSVETWEAVGKNHWIIEFERKSHQSGPDVGHPWQVFLNKSLNPDLSGLKNISLKVAGQLSGPVGHLDITETCFDSRSMSEASSDLCLHCWLRHGSKWNLSFVITLLKITTIINLILLELYLWWDIQSHVIKSIYSISFCKSVCGTRLGFITCWRFLNFFHCQSLFEVLLINECF